jgi:uncharacterized membrane protein
MSEQQQQKTSVKLAIVLGGVALGWYVLSMLVVLHG